MKNKTEFNYNNYILCNVPYCKKKSTDTELKNIYIKGC